MIMLVKSPYFKHILYTVTGKSLVTNFQIAITFDLDDVHFKSIYHFNPDSIIFFISGFDFAVAGIENIM